MQQPYCQYCQYCQVHYTLHQSQTHHQCYKNYPQMGSGHTGPCLTAECDCSYSQGKRKAIHNQELQPYQFTLQDLANKIDAIRDNLNKQNLEILAKLIELIAKQ
jgi:hypothetical protein